MNFIGVGDMVTQSFKVQISRAQIDYQPRRGASLILTVIMMFGLFSFLACSVDTGYLSQSRAEIRRAADASAMAGCWELYEHMEGGAEAATAHPDVRQACGAMVALNPINRHSPHIDTSETTEDVTIGFMNDLKSGIITQDSSNPYYAVRVNVTKSHEKNGEVPFFFGKIFGQSGREMQADATAVMARQIKGFATPPAGRGRIDLLPFALDLNTWQALLNNNADDNYRYDPVTGTVSTGTDNIREVNLYPQGTGSPGNRGTVDIGGANNSTNDIARQIVDGISAEDLVALGKPLVLDGNGILDLNGDTGISAGVKDELESIIGEKRIIPIFSSVTGNGNNANYRIVKWVGVRILDVKLTGKMSGKKLIVQPAPMLTSFGVTASAGAQSSDFLLSSVVLAR
jgi:hypothetical protein